MAIELNCTNPKCGKWQQPTIDTKTNKVYCAVCDGEQNVSHFTKLNLKTVGQIKTAAKSAYSVKCASCKWDALPKFANGQFSCPQCSGVHKNISKPFENLIKDEIKKVKDENGKDR